MSQAVLPLAEGAEDGLAALAGALPRDPAPSPRLAGGHGGEGEDALERFAEHPHVVECRRAAAVLAAHLEAHPQDEQAQDWAFLADERIDACALALADGAQQEAAAHAKDARADRAAMITDELVDQRGFVYAPDAFAALDADTRALLTEYAAPYPVRWLFPRPTAESERVLIKFHGPGGWAWGIREVLRASDVDMVGVDVEAAAVQTARAAGFEVVHASVLDLRPDHPALVYVTGQLPSPPCQGFSGAGLGLGRSTDAVRIITDVMRTVPAAVGVHPSNHLDGTFAGLQRSGQSWAEVREDLQALADDRPGLMVEVLIWAAAALHRCGGDLRWIAMEQSDRLPAPILRELCAVLRALGFKTVETETLDSVVHGAASHRKRLFVTAYLGDVAPIVPSTPAHPMPVTSFAKLTGWDESDTVMTRGQRGINPLTGKPKGGGSFSASQVSTCITATSYGWKSAQTGARMTQPDIGRAVGFPADYPWTHVGRGEGVRNKAQLAADVVAPMTAAAVVGRALGREWEPQTRAYVHELYDQPAEPATPDAAPDAAEAAAAASDGTSFAQCELFM